MESLIDRLWGDDLPANPNNALQVRGHLGGFTSTKPAGYLLEVDPDDVDVSPFASAPSSVAAMTWRGPWKRRDVAVW